MGGVLAGLGDKKLGFPVKSVSCLRLVGPAAVLLHVLKQALPRQRARRVLVEFLYQLKAVPVGKNTKIIDYFRFGDIFSVFKILKNWFKLFTFVGCCRGRPREKMLGASQTSGGSGTRLRRGMPKRCVGFSEC